ncbi:Hypothetical predicted protein [Paramuricea clavata]|uniref:Uncharacterized protein n=1 Tax=Paramuricea clavata TaxID=317549 RepID=A0A6S7L6L5_PARCT|nr:Hypothetical predicted protein [Paramuricea clavata]
MQFGKSSETKIEFNLGEKETLQEVNQGVQGMEYLNSGTSTGDALRRSREEIFNGEGIDRIDAPNVLLLFTDGQATDKQGKQVEQAKKLKDDGVKVITVGMGERETIDNFREKLREMASRDSDSAAPLMFETAFEYLDLIANNLVEEACDTSAAG